MTDRTARVMLAGAALLAAAGLARATDALQRSLMGNGEAEGAVSLAVLLVVTVAFILLRRYIKGRKPRPRLRSWPTVSSWTLGAAIPLLAVAMVRAPFLDTAQAFFIANMRDDLRELMAVQDSVMQAAGRFEAHPPLVTSPGVHYPEIALTADGWSARIERNGSLAHCVIYDGTTMLSPARVPRLPACTRLPFDVAATVQGLIFMAAGLVVAGVLVATRRPAVVVERRVP